ncbi:MAG: NUDIX domain-containing protein [Propionibacteriales bacterium]|nr:NUDIX domain-containing protein [Propionibacteriales bacterium]
MPEPNRVQRHTARNKGLRIRPAARAVITDPDRRALLVHFDFAADLLPTGLWACAGGGIDPGETAAEAVVRELREELGLEVADPGTPVWWKEHVFAMTRWDGQHDTFFWLEVDAFEPRPQFTVAELRAEHVDTMRWWAYDEIQAAQRRFDTESIDEAELVTFSPRRFGHLLADLFSRGRPDEPFELAEH